MLKKLLSLLFLCVSAIFLPVYAQDCKPPAIVANKGVGNIFSPEQEVILGELTLQRLSTEFRQINDPGLQKFVDDMGRKIIKHLPPTGLTFTFHIVEYPEANAFNVPGGHIFLSRKLISFVNSEDELAGVIAHELGHATVHHGAIDMSTLMRTILRVTSLGDRKDIIEKYNLMIENARTKNVSRKAGHEGEQQLEADRIAIFSMISAGYDPDAFYTFFDRLTESEGKTGNWFSDLFGQTKPEQKRLREMHATTNQLPPECRDSATATATEEFLRWQADVVMYRDSGRQEELPGLVSKKDLQPKLRSDINHLAFSPDGKLLLVQDEFAVTLVDLKTRKVSYQIPAQDADEAMFTTDGKYVVFLTSNLRFERWDVATQKPVEVRELVLFNECAEPKLSPDGNYLACVDRDLTARIIDIKTGKKVWEKKIIYQFSFYEDLFFSVSFDRIERTHFFQINFSPDSRYAVFSRSPGSGFAIILNNYYLPAAVNPALAVDIPAKKSINPGGEINRIASAGYIFLDSGRILGMPSGDPKDSGVFSFPEGKRLQKFTLGGNNISRTENPDIVVVKPMVETKLGVFDVKRGVILAGMNKDEVTLWNNLAAFESVGGKVMVRELSGGKGLEGKDIAEIDIPVISIGNLRAVGVSNSFGWLSMSAKSRGGMWNLATGERKIFTRGFRGTLVADDGGAVSFFPKLGTTPNALVLMNPHANEVTTVRDVPETSSYQSGRFVLGRTKLGKGPSSEKDDKKKQMVGGEVVDTSNIFMYGQGMRLEIKDVVRDEVIWSREFPKFPARYTFDAQSGRLILYTSLQSEQGKAKLREFPEMQAKASALGNKEGDYFVEIFDAYAKKTIGTLLVETGKGSFYLRTGLSAGDWIAFYDSEQRVLVYSIKDGTLLHRFFGLYAAINPVKNLVAVQNFPGEISIYDLKTGESRSKLVFNGTAIFIKFNLEGNKLFVLTNEQAAYAFDLNKMMPAGN
jgi:hypothetical protein